ncbi:MAG: hypothetical protein QNK31_10835 [Porticoccus sp.]|nr:hypothetical protein [Porticoccus sp.]
MNNQRLMVTVVLVLMSISWLNFLDDYGDRYTTNALKQSAASYAVARGINAVVSVLQSTEVSVGFASISPGEALDPLNDLVERFSWIAMMAMASLGLQKLLLLMASSILFKVLITITGSMLIYGLLRRDSHAQHVMIRLFVVALFLRFAVGSVVLANDIVEYVFLEESRTQATEQLENTRVSLSDISLGMQQGKEEKGILEGIKDNITSLMGNREEEIKKNTEEASTSIVDLIVVYIAQALLFPILFLWMFYKMTSCLWAINWAEVLKRPGQTGSTDPLPATTNTE